MPPRVRAERPTSRGFLRRQRLDRPADKGHGQHRATRPRPMTNRVKSAAPASRLKSRTALALHTWGARLGVATTWFQLTKEHTAARQLLEIKSHEDYTETSICIWAFLVYPGSLALSHQIYPDEQQASSELREQAPQTDPEFQDFPCPSQTA